MTAIPNTCLTRRLAGLGLAALVLLAPGAAALAQSARPAALTAADKADITRVETYLNSIHTMTSRFIQIAPNGGVSQGTIYMQRPGKMRVQYDPPVQDIIVATGKVLIHYEGDLDQPTYLPLSSSPAAFLLEKHITLSDDVTVTKVKQSPGRLMIDLVQSDDPGKGSLHLVFSESPLALRQWQVRDAEGKLTQVTLVNPRFNVPIDPVKFLFETPSPRRAAPAQ